MQTALLCHLIATAVTGSALLLVVSVQWAAARLRPLIQHLRRVALTPRPPAARTGAAVGTSATSVVRRAA